MGLECVSTGLEADRLYIMAMSLTFTNHSVSGFHFE